MMTMVIQVKPNARQNAIEKTDLVWIVRLRAPAVDGKANAALIAFLADYLGIPQSRIFIKRGLRSRHKVVHIL